VSGHAVTAEWLRTLLGTDAVVEASPSGPPVAAPRNADECALLLRTATEQGWRVRVEGTGNWIAPDTPADLVMTTRELAHVHDVNAADLVATVDAGIGWDELRGALADHGVWLALDAPGMGRSLGSIVAAATVGPLRAGFGTPRDHILGMTLVTGDGRILHLGGKVMKNVAGYDLAKLAAGSFGAFGVITSLHLRLRSVPRADVTLTAHGNRDRLLESARGITDAGLSPAGLELLSPTAGGEDDWILGIRCLGTDAEVAADREAVLHVGSVPLVERPATEASAFWRTALARCTDHPVTVRIGALPDALDTALDLVAHHLDEAVRDWISVTVPAGMLRWSGDADVRDLSLLRRKLAEQEMPLTLERAPWPVRRPLGHFGAYREGVARLVNALRQSFDPAGVLAVPLGDM